MRIVRSINYIKHSVIIVLLCLIVFPAKANNLPDVDKDGVPDKDEIEIYKTNPEKFDTDNDGYGDGEELRSGFSPHNSARVKLEVNDYDVDGLSDRMELNFHADLTNHDTDSDGYKDGEEIAKGFDPLKGDGAKLDKKIEINLKKQELSYFLGNVKFNTFKVSTGRASLPTPKGDFKIREKKLRGWSKPYGLWMPYWLGLGNFGIHELPIWPNGYREGENHLGIPVSHGCIRLGIGPAKILYDWTEVGTAVVIY